MDREQEASEGQGQQVFTECQNSRVEGQTHPEANGQSPHQGISTQEDLAQRDLERQGTLARCPTSSPLPSL